MAVNCCSKDNVCVRANVPEVLLAVQLLPVHGAATGVRHRHGGGAVDRGARAQSDGQEGAHALYTIDSHTNEGSQTIEWRATQCQKGWLLGGQAASTMCAAVAWLQERSLNLLLPPAGDLL